MPPERTAGNTSIAWRHEGQRQYKTRWYGLGGEESSSTAITRRYHLSRRPCPQDGIINPTTSLEMKIEANTEEVSASLLFRSYCLLKILIISYKSLTLRIGYLLNQLNR